MNIETMPETADDMSRDEQSLLLYLETRCVDYGGRVSTKHMNSDDHAIAEHWNKSGFLEFGRIFSRDLSDAGTHWVKFTERAWDFAHQLRRQRYERSYANRRWQTTEESRA